MADTPTWVGWTNNEDDDTLHLLSPRGLRRSRARGWGWLHWLTRRCWLPWPAECGANLPTLTVGFDSTCCECEVARIKRRPAVAARRWLSP